MAKDSLLRGVRSALLAGALFGQVGAETTDRDWTHYGADPASTKFADVSQIDSTNFDSLRIIWRWTVPDSVLLDSLGLESDRYRNTPIVVDGVLYTLSPLHQLCALDAATGAPLWTYDPESWRVESEFSGFGRGLSYWSDGDQSRIIFGTASAYLHSVDARSGRPDPDFGVDGRIDLTQGLGRPVDRGSYAQVSAPAIWGDIIIAGSSAMDWRLGRDLPPILPPVTCEASTCVPESCCGCSTHHHGMASSAPTPGSPGPGAPRAAPTCGRR